MSFARGDILRRAAQVEPDAVPEPWRASDDEDALATVSDREHYRKNLVTLPDGAGEVPAYVWDFPRTPTIPDEVREEWTRGSAGRVLNAQGQYVSKGSDVPRKSYDGEDPGLLVEAGSRTNQLTESNGLTEPNWGTINTSVTTASSALFDGENGYLLAGTGSNLNDRIINSTAGTYTSSDEVYAVIFEESTSDLVRFRVDETSNNDRIAAANYEFSTDNLWLDDGLEANARTLTLNGPNGGRVVRVVLRYNATTETDFSGLGRRAYIYPDRNGSNKDVYVHHAQIEEALNASSPIVTKGSAVTRSADDYAIFSGGQPPWWNPNEGTFVLRFSVRQRKRTVNQQLLGVNSQSRIITLGTGGRIFTFDGDFFAEAPTQITPFSVSTAAVSFSQKDLIVSHRGESSASSSNGSFLNASTINLGNTNTEFFEIKKLTYFPRALPESTLNRITS